MSLEDLNFRFLKFIQIKMFIRMGAMKEIRNKKSGCYRLGTRREGKLGEDDKRVQTSSCKTNRSEDLVYNMVTKVDNTHV